MKIIRLLPIICMLIITGINKAAAFDEPANRLILKGLKDFIVAVQCSDDTKKYGLSEYEIQSDIELKLRMAGIKVVRKQEINDPDTAGLVAIVDVYDRPENNHVLAFNIHLGVAQHVSLLRNNSIQVMTDTWALGRLGTVGSDNIRMLRDNVKDLADQFINAYLAANSKP